jgi:ABC-type transport system involved in multi-copper enzyme maturation permease subunit
LLPLTWIPTVLLTWMLGTRLFRLKMANAELRRYFSDEVWDSRKVLRLGLVFLVLCVTLLPLAIVLAWSHTLAAQGAGVVSTGHWLLGGVGRGLGWVWTQGLILLATWFYLRLGMDLVDAFEGMLDQMGRDRARRRQSRGHKIWRNPVAWREARVSAWGRGGLPLLIGWGLVLFAVLQTGLWLIPGGTLTVGAANAAAALLLTVWLAAGSIEQERHGSTLEMVLVSRMSSTRIVWGKLIALALPTLPVVVLSMPFLVLGFAHLDMLFAFDSGNTAHHYGYSLLRGVLTCVWLLAFWLFAAVVAMWIALKVRNPASAYGAAVGAISTFLLVPTFLAWVLSEWWWAALPFRLVIPVATRFPSALEILASTGGLVVASIVVFVVIATRVRSWGGAK